MFLLYQIMINYSIILNKYLFGLIQKLVIFLIVLSLDHCRQDELIYNEGLMDGIIMGYWVALIGRGVEKIRV